MGVPAFCFTNLLESGSITVSSEATGFPKENAYDWRTDDFWQPDGSESPAVYIMTADMTTATAADYGAVYAHDLHTQGATLLLEYASDSGFTADTGTAFTVTPTTSAPIVRTFTSVSRRYWRFRITGASSPPSIGVLAFGPRLDMEQGIRAGSLPPTFARVPDTMPNRALKGAFVGMSVIRRGVKFSADFNAVTPAWLRTNWASFQDHHEAKPFFYSWDPANYPNEAVFCWIDGNAGLPVYSAEKYLSISLPLVGFYL